MAGRKPSSSTKSPARQRRARGSLSREEILDAARRFVEQHGLQPLSYPRLAKELGAATASLYWYFHSKEELLAALVDEVTREMYLRLAPVGDGPWDEEIVEHHVAFRALLRSSPVYSEIVAYSAQTLFLQSRMAPVVLRNTEGDLAMLVRAGLSPDEAAQAFNAFSVYTRAFVLVEQGIAQEQIDPEALQMINFALAQAASDLPAVGSVESVDRMFVLDDELYRRGLRLLVAGLCEVYPALRRSRRSRDRVKEASA